VSGGRWLTRRGAAAALAVGGATAWGLGWRGCVLLLAFFMSANLLGTKGGARNARQVIANGGVAAIAALRGHWLGFAGALAAANADTWATEIGRRSRTPPRLITTAAPVPPGTDGGMTLLGTIGGIAGAVFIAGVSVLLDHNRAPAIAAAGTCGMLLDSLLGATVQGRIRMIDNDAVNLAATLAGAVLAGVLG
jgi:uncharacterized protein (TIGR00297 family)